MKIKLATLLLVFLASIKVIADLTGWKEVSALAAIFNVSPAMKVFTAHHGYETFSSEYYLKIIYEDESEQTTQLTPKNYQGLSGPYNRRNVYGAAIAYGPILSASTHTAGMWTSVTQYAFCDNNAILRELDFPNKSPVKQVVLTYQRHSSSSVTSEQQYPNQLEVTCHAI